MNAITDTWRQLVRRKLWPLVLLLVAALVAVPYLLAKEPAAAVTPPAAHAAGADASSATVVTLADDAVPAGRRRVLGPAKDPFEPAPLPKAKKAKKAKATPTPTAAPTDSSPGGGSTAPPSSGPPAGPEPTATPQPTIPKYSIKVKFGPTDGDTTTSTLQRLEPLPSVESPVLVYEGVEDGGKVAVFSIPGTVTAQGDGVCDPAPEECATLRLKAGETEFVTVTDTGDAAVDAQYQLELVKIFTKETVAESDSSATTPTAQSSAQRKRLEGYRYDASTGTLHRVGSRSKRASP
jgi:hypothetical protein